MYTYSADMVDNSPALRPHHALCIGFFQGKGYSPDFVENMAAVAARLRAEDPVVTLRCGSDAICRSCPNDRGGVCKSAEKVARYDAAVLRLVGLSDGAALRWSALRSAVRRHILDPAMLAEVCGDCQWFAVCKEQADDR